MSDCKLKPLPPDPARHQDSAIAHRMRTPSNHEQCQCSTSCCSELRLFVISLILSAPRKAWVPTSVRYAPARVCAPWLPGAAEEALGSSQGSPGWRTAACRSDAPSGLDRWRADPRFAPARRDSVDGKRVAGRFPATPRDSEPFAGPVPGRRRWRRALSGRPSLPRCGSRVPLCFRRPAVSTSQVVLFNSSGSFATLAAIRRASILQAISSAAFDPQSTSKNIARQLCRTNRRQASV